MKMSMGNVYVGPGFLLMIAAVIIFSGLKVAVMAAAAALIHELGHIAAILLCGGEIGKIRVGTVGAEIVFTGTFSYCGDAAIALAGPVASLFAAMVSGAVGSYFGLNGAVLFAGVNILYCVLNLVPASAMDGGKAVYAVISALFEPFKAEKVRYILDISCFLIVMAAGIYVFAKSGGNLTLFLCAILLADACCKSGKSGVKSHQ